MDYNKFFAEVAEWINEANDKAVKYGLQSHEFWTWVMRSTGEMCERYNNNDLVKNQIAMLVNWLMDLYANNKKQQVH